MTTPFDWKSRLTDCLRATEYLCLATVDTEQGTWSNPVYFSWDNQAALYFISLSSSRHMKNITKDARISAAIYPTNQSTHGDVFGIQLTGNARILETTEEITSAYQQYYHRVHPETDQSIGSPLSSFLAKNSWRLVQILPNEIYYFNTEFFPEETHGRQCVPLPLQVDLP